MLPIKFQDNQPFVSEEEAKIRFSRGRPWGPSWISHHNNFSYFFLSTNYLVASYQVSCQLAYCGRKYHVSWPSCQEKKRKIDFQDGGHGSHLGIQIGTILAIFALQDTPKFPTKFQVNWPLGSREEVKNRFSR